jgi:hypothetical protein
MLVLSRTVDGQEVSLYVLLKTVTINFSLCRHICVNFVATSTEKRT